MLRHTTTLAFCISAEVVIGRFTLMPCRAGHERRLETGFRNVLAKPGSDALGKRPPQIQHSPVPLLFDISF